MNSTEIIEAIDSGKSIHEINPDNPWAWAIDQNGSKEFPEIRDRAKEMLKIIPSQHTTRNYTGGRDSISVIMTTYNSMNIMLPSIFSVLKQTHSNLQLVIAAAFFITAIE